MFSSLSLASRKSGFLARALSKNSSLTRRTLTYLSRRVEDMFSSLSLASRKSGSLARARLKAFSASSILFYRVNHDTVHFTFKVFVNLGPSIRYSLPSYTVQARDGILGHQFTEYFPSFYSQSLLLADFKENQTLLWFQKSLQRSPRNKKTPVYS